MVDKNLGRIPEVIRSAAFGRTELPDADDFRGWWDDAFAPLLRFTLATALEWAPAVAWIVHTRGIAALLEPERFVGDTWVLAARAVFTFARLLADALRDSQGAADAYRLLLARFPHDVLAPQDEAALRRLGKRENRDG